MRAWVLLATLLPCPLLAQTAAPADHDTLVFSNGEQLTGTLEKADAKGITFNSPVAGVLTVAWKNVRDLQTHKHFAVLAEHAKLTRRNADSVVPVGPVHATAEQVEVATASGNRTVATANTGHVIPATDFEQALHRQPGLLQGWGGTATAGASLVRATENSTTFNGNVALERATPAVDWLAPRTRSSVNYDQSYGSTSTPTTDPATGLPITNTIKTNIFHAAAEYDQYLSPRLFALGDVAFDHNFAQNLSLQQAYGGGLGLTVFKTPRHQLDFKGDVHYEKQAFFAPTRSLNLFGSTFSDRYLRNLAHAIVFTEFASISPAWNDTSAYSAHADASLTFPVFHSLGFTLGAVDDYLNNAPAGSKKNTFQFTSGLTFAIKPR